VKNDRGFRNECRENREEKREWKRRNNVSVLGAEFGRTGMGRQMRGEEFYCVASKVILDGTRKS
jgi:hypothetical protein